MSFSMKFLVPESLSFRSDEMNDDAANSPYSVVLDACEQLDEAGCQFEVQGFGLRWATDVGYDLAMVLETFPSVVAAIESGSATELDFASQGLERKVILQAAGDSVQLRVERFGASDTAAADPEVEVVDKESLIQSMTLICAKVAESISQVNPALGSLPPMSDWRGGSLTPSC